MTIEELLAKIGLILEMDDQADRSIALDEVREAISAIGGDLESYEQSITDLEESKNKLLERNKALFNRVDGRPTKEEGRHSTSQQANLKNSLETGTFFD